MTKESDWLQKEFPDQPIREGRTMEDPDFPRIAITYFMDENAASAKEKQDEIQQIISEYNEYYHTAWTIAEIERYNGDINNRLSMETSGI